MINLRIENWCSDFNVSGLKVANLDSLKAHNVLYNNFISRYGNFTRINKLKII